MNIISKDQKADIPVPYIVLSNHLDMVGVKLCARYRETRLTNGDELQDKVKKVIGLRISYFTEKGQRVAWDKSTLR